MAKRPPHRQLQAVHRQHRHSYAGIRQAGAAVQRRLAHVPVDNPLVQGAPCVIETGAPDTSTQPCPDDAYANQAANGGAYDVPNFHRIVVHGGPPTRPNHWSTCVSPTTRVPATRRRARPSGRSAGNASSRSLRIIPVRWAACPPPIWRLGARCDRRRADSEGYWPWLSVKKTQRRGQGSRYSRPAKAGYSAATRSSNASPNTPRPPPSCARPCGARRSRPTCSGIQRRCGC